MAQYILSVGVDVGVVTTGISYCLVGPGELAVSPHLVPLGRSQTQLQPTVLGTSAGGGPAWGNEVAADNVARLALLKLALLHPDTIQSANPEYPGHIATVKAEIDKLGAAGKTGPKAVAEYIACLRPDLTARAREYMEALGLRPADVSVRFVFGIPAVWGNDALARMREAIETSNILTFSDGCPAPMDFIAEPEAAALALVPEISRSYALQVGNTVIICDCGGGTVDVITYEIVSLSPLSLEECVPGNGKLLGDMFMKGALADLIKRRVAAAANCPANVDNRWLDGEVEKAWNAVCETPIVRLTQPSWTHAVEVKHLDAQCQGRVTLAGPDIVEALRTTTGGILDLVQSQANQVRLVKGCSPDLLVVVGGFGCNSFLQHELRRQFSGGTMKIAYTQERGMMAVQDGAALAGVNRSFHPLATSGPLQSLLHQPHIIATAPVTVRKRVARYSYGFWDGNGPQNQITWFITKGQKVPADITVAAFDLPRAGFILTNNGLELRVYCTPETRAGISAIDGGQVLCCIRCASRDHLRLAASLRLGFLITTHNIEPRLSVTGADHVTRSFSLVIQ